VHGNPIGPLSSINNDHVVGDDAMAMATMQGENSPLSLSWSPSRMMAPFRMLWWGRRLDVLHCEAERALLASRTNANTPRGAESPIRDVTVTEHADAKAGRSRRVQVNMNKSTQERTI